MKIRAVGVELFRAGGEQTETQMDCVYCAVRSTFYVLPTQCIYVFCVDLRTNSDYFTVQH